MFEVLLKNADRGSEFVFFTGAGISTESGIKDFRSEDGLYSEGLFNGYAPEEILGNIVFKRNPDIFFRYYFEKLIKEDHKPNLGHRAIAAIEKAGFSVSVVTQNIDGLHHAAGSGNVMELHGRVTVNYCVDCGKRFGLEYIRSYKGNIPLCDSCKGVVRPDIVLYGEIPDHHVFSKAGTVIANADFLFAVGSSLTVYPAAGLLDCFAGKHFCIINREPTPFDAAADLVIDSDSSRVLDVLYGETANVFK